MGQVIDINCDMGEGAGNEHLLMPYISSCNIACGEHAGDSATMSRVVQLAIKHKVKIGAHPGYPDPQNFGRKTMEIKSSVLKSSIRLQVGSLARVAADFGMKLFHIKPHGALYNDAAKDEGLASAVLSALDDYREDCLIYLPHGSVIAKRALKGGFSVKYEAFADRNYNDDLGLVPRSDSRAVLHRPEDVTEHMLTILEKEKVKTVSGKLLPLKAQTFCIHGDHENSVLIARHIYDELTGKGYEIK